MKNSIVDMRKLICLLLVLLCGLAACKDYGPSPEPGSETMDSTKFKQVSEGFYEGKQLFKEHCEACHWDFRIRHIDGPTLDGVFERLPEPADDYFIKFVSDMYALIAAGDKYATNLANEYVNAPHPVFRNKLSRKEIGYIGLFLKVASYQKHMKIKQ